MEADTDKVDRKRNKLRKRKRMISWIVYENRYYENSMYFDAEQKNFFDKGDDYDSAKL